MKLWKFFFLLAVGFIQFDSLTSSSIKAQVNSSLEESWNIKFDIFVKHSEGLALYATDSSNRLLILFSSESIIFAFNSNSTTIELNKICGCSICKNFFILFDIVKKRKEVTFYTECGGKKEEIKNNYKIYKKLYNYPKTKETKNTNKTYFWMSNTEPFTNDQNKTMYPSKDQLYGCLNTFSYKNTSVLFNGNNTFFQSTCTKTCLPKYCNGGSCLEQRSKAPICDCSFTAKNGDQCLRNFTDYSFGNNTSLKVPHSEEIIPFKLSWRHENITNYCLLELKAKDFNKVIHVDKNSIKYNKEVILTLIPNTDYFLNIKVMRKNIIIMFEKMIKEINHSETVRINVGFSSYNKCNTYTGKYDIYYNTSQIKQFKKTDDAARTSHLKLGKINSISKRFYILPVVFVGILGFLSALIFIIVNIIMRLRNRKVQLKEINKRNIESDIYMSPENVRNKNTFYDILDNQNEDDAISMEVVYANFHDTRGDNIGSDDEPPALPPRDY